MIGNPLDAPRCAGQTDGVDLTVWMDSWQMDC
jgi:hypothetical protein